MTVKVGQRVRLKSLEVCKPMQATLRVGIRLGMHRHFGTIVTIASLDSDGVEIEEDGDDWVWAPEWFEDLIELSIINIKDIV